MHNRFAAVFNIITGYRRHRKSRFRPLDSAAIPSGIKRFVVMSNPKYIGTYASRSLDYNIPLDDLASASYFDFYRNNVKIAVFDVVRIVRRNKVRYFKLLSDVAFSSVVNPSFSGITSSVFSSQVLLVFFDVPRV